MGRVSGGTVVVVAVVAGALATGAAAAGPVAAPTPWDGVNPFRCTLQHAGLGTSVPDPEADPYCVDFDKTHQNVTQLGIAGFLSEEPARVAAAVPKCFYFQSDHWRSAVIQDDGRTQLYRWDGHYFFDKATGNGGAWVTNVSVNGHPSPRDGGMITHDAIPADPRCAARAAAHPERIYADAPPPAQAPEAAHGCVSPGGPVRRHRLGPVRVGERDPAVRAALGDPQRVRHGYARYCADGGGALLIHRHATVLVATARRLLHRAPSRRHAHLAFRAGRTRVLRLHNGAFAGVRRHRLRFVAAGAVRRRALHRAGVLG